MVRIARGFLAGGEDSVLAGGRGFQQTESGDAIFNNILARGDIEANSIDLATARIKGILSAGSIDSDVINWEPLWIGEEEVGKVAESFVFQNNADAGGSDLIAVLFDYQSVHGAITFSAEIPVLATFINTTLARQAIITLNYSGTQGGVTNDGLYFRISADRDSAVLQTFSNETVYNVVVHGIWRIDSTNLAQET